MNLLLLLGLAHVCSTSQMHRSNQSGLAQMRVEEVRIDLRYFVGATTLLLHVRRHILQYLCHSLLHLPRLYPILDSLFLPQPRAVP